MEMEGLGLPQAWGSNCNSAVSCGKTSDKIQILSDVGKYIQLLYRLKEGTFSGHIFHCKTHQCGSG